MHVQQDQIRLYPGDQIQSLFTIESYFDVETFALELVTVGARKDGLILNDYDCVHKINLGLVPRLSDVLLKKFAGKFEELVGLRQSSRSIFQTSCSACVFKLAERNRHGSHAAVCAGAR